MELLNDRFKVEMTLAGFPGVEVWDLTRPIAAVIREFFEARVHGPPQVFTRLLADEDVTVQRADIAELEEVTKQDRLSVEFIYIDFTSSDKRLSGVSISSFAGARGAGPEARLAVRGADRITVDSMAAALATELRVSRPISAVAGAPTVGKVSFFSINDLGEEVVHTQSSAIMIVNALMLREAAREARANPAAPTVAIELKRPRKKRSRWAQFWKRYAWPLTLAIVAPVAVVAIVAAIGLSTGAIP
jgi:hypothetical protein